MGVNLDYKKLLPGIPTYFETEINGVKYTQGYQEPPSQENDYYNTKEFRPKTHEKHRNNDNLNMSFNEFKTYSQPPQAQPMNYAPINTQSYAPISRMTIGPQYSSHQVPRNSVNLFSTYTTNVPQRPQNIFPSSSLSSLHYNSNLQNYSSNLQNIATTSINLQKLPAYNLSTNIRNISQYPVNYISNLNQYSQSGGYFTVGGPVLISKQFVDNNSPVQNIPQYQLSNYYDNLNRSFEYPKQVQKIRIKSVERDNRKKLNESKTQFELINKPGLMIQQKVPIKQVNTFPLEQKNNESKTREIVDQRNFSKNVSAQVYTPHSTYFQNLVDEDDSPNNDQVNEES